MEIDSSVPALKCQLLPESTVEETLFISINPFSGLYKVVSYMGEAEIYLYFLLSIRLAVFIESHYSQQIEISLNRDQTNLIDAINSYKYENSLFFIKVCYLH